MFPEKDYKEVPSRATLRLLWKDFNKKNGYVSYKEFVIIYTTHIEEWNKEVDKHKENKDAKQ